VIPVEIRGVRDAFRFDPPRFASVAVELRSSRRELEALTPDAVQAFIDLAGSSSGPHTLRNRVTAAQARRHAQRGLRARLLPGGIRGQS